jgi:hypothetical protein
MFYYVLCINGINKCESLGISGINFFSYFLFKPSSPLISNHPSSAQFSFLSYLF